MDLSIDVTVRVRAIVKTLSTDDGSDRMRRFESSPAISAGTTERSPNVHLNEDSQTNLLEPERTLLDTFGQLLANLNSNDDVESVPYLLLEAVIRTTPFKLSWAALYNKKTHLLSRQFAAGFPTEISSTWGDRYMSPEEREPAMRALRSGVPFIISDVLRTKEFPEMTVRSALQGYRSSLYIPVHLEQDEWVILSFHQPTPHDFTESEQSLAAAIAAFAAVAFRNAIARDNAVSAHKKASETVAQQNLLLQHMSDVQHALLQAQLNGNGFESICKVLSHWLSSPIVLLDRFHQVIASIGFSVDKAQGIASKLRTELGDTMPLTSDSRPTVVSIDDHPMVLGVVADRHTILGLCISEPAGPFGFDTDSAVLDLGCLYLSLDFAHQRSQLEAELRNQDDFVSALIKGGEAELARRSSILGLNLNSRRTVYRARIQQPENILDPADFGELSNFLRRRLLQASPDAVVAPARPNDLIVVLPYSADQAEYSSLIRSSLIDGIASMTFTPSRKVSIAIGIGEAGAGLTGLERSQSGATRALEVIDAQTTQNQDLHINSAGSSALLTIPDQEQKSAFVHRYLENIIGYDTKNGSELLSTLRVYFAQVGNVKRTADLLYLHISTVRHRLSRIEILAAVSLRDEDDRLCLQLAIRLLDILDSGQPGESIT